MVVTGGEYAGNGVHQNGQFGVVDKRLLVQIEFADRLQPLCLGTPVLPRQISCQIGHPPQIGDQGGRQDLAENRVAARVVIFNMSVGKLKSHRILMESMRYKVIY